MKTASNNTIIKLNDVLAMTLLSKSTLYMMIQEGRFPQQIKIGKRLSVWRKEDIDAWLAVKFSAGNKEDKKQEEAEIEDLFDDTYYLARKIKEIAHMPNGHVLTGQDRYFLMEVKSNLLGLYERYLQP